MKLASEINFQGLPILIVEDDLLSLTMLTNVLEQYGATVDTAANGDEALTRLEMKRYPVIVTDICLPGMDGLELVEHIRVRDKHTQIIATSVNSTPECLISAIELGFNDYFLKPLEMEKLLWAIKRCHETFVNMQLLDEVQQKFQTVADCLGEGLAIKDLDYRILYQNKVITGMFGDRTGSPCYEIFGRHDPCLECPTVKALEDGQTHTGCREYLYDGTTINIESTASLIRDSSGRVTGSVEIVRDISERIRNEQTIRDMAFCDPLTGLANRRLFEDHLALNIAKSKRYGMKFGLMCLDLDYFKKINDTFGHDAGDQVLRETADRISACCKRDLDTISRQGGDEFCIIIDDCGSRENLVTISDALIQAFTRPFRIADSLIEVTTSIGVSIFPDNGMEMKELEIAADRAMYAAKKAGRNTCRFWEPMPQPHLEQFANTRA